MTAEELTHAQARKLANRFLDEVPTPGEPYGVVRDGCAMARYILSLPPDTDAQAQRIAALEAQLAECEQRLDHTLIAHQEAVSGALATARAVTLTEEERETLNWIKQCDWVPRIKAAAELIDRFTNGASTPAHPTEGEKL